MSSLPVAPVTDPPPIAGVTRRYVEARGISFHVTEATGPPPFHRGTAPADDESPEPLAVLALHGWPQHHYLFRDLLGAPPPGMRIIAPDLPGYGWSSAPEHRWAKEQVASDLLALMDVLELGRRPGNRVILVGHDWGGYVGYLMALREPARFGAFLALNIAHPWNTPRTTLPHALRLAAYQPWIAAFGVPLMRRTGLVARGIRSSLSDRSALSPAETHWYSERFREPACARAGTDTYRTFLLRELPRVVAGRGERRRLEVPTHALFGIDDIALHYSLAAAETANADEYRLELVPGCGHFIVDERPALIRERLLSLADRVRSTTPVRTG